MDSQLHWLTEVLLVLGYADMVRCERLVSQLRDDDEREKPVCRFLACCIRWQIMPPCTDIEYLHRADSDCIVSMFSPYTCCRGNSLAKFCKHLAGEHDIGASAGETQNAATERKVNISYSLYKPFVWKYMEK
jgi:hypothetical protein